jgi:hypothetical protein
MRSPCEPTLYMMSKSATSLPLVQFNKGLCSVCVVVQVLDNVFKQQACSYRDAVCSHFVKPFLCEALRLHLCARLRRRARSLEECTRIETCAACTGPTSWLQSQGKVQCMRRSTGFIQWAMTLRLHTSPGVHEKRCHHHLSKKSFKAIMSR